jgi:hypothetical protein
MPARQAAVLGGWFVSSTMADEARASKPITKLASE